MFKRGSLELSINAIVVLILAITILGLGLGFIRSQFGGMTKQFTGVSEEIDKELTDKIRTSGEILTFNKENMEVKKGVEDTFYIGISNTDGFNQCFQIQVGCVKALSSGNGCLVATGGPYNHVLVGGTAGAANGIPAYSPITTFAPGVTAPTWFRVFSKVDIGGSDVGVYPIYVQIPAAAQDTYLMEINVYSTKSVAPAFPNGVKCSDAAAALPGTNYWNQNVYQTKQFYVTVS